MKVKIGDQIFSDEDTPIMIIMSDYDKSNISNMGDSKKYASAPDGRFASEDECINWMKG